MGIDKCNSPKDATSTCFRYCKPTGDFIILEELIPPVVAIPIPVPKSPVPLPWPNKGRETVWIRRIWQLCEVQDQFIDDERLEIGSLWHAFKYYTGLGKYVEKPTGKSYMVLSYAKKNHIIKFSQVNIPSLPDGHIKDVQEFWNKTAGRVKGFTLPNVMPYGKDPLPQYILLDNLQASFILPRKADGSLGHPRAMAIYSTKNKRFSTLKSEEEIKKLYDSIEELTK